MTNKEIFYASDYDAENEDNVHNCSDKRPTASIQITGGSSGEDEESGSWEIKASAAFGTYELATYELRVNGVLVKSGSLDKKSETIVYPTTTKPTSVNFRVVDTAGYTTTATR